MLGTSFAFLVFTLSAFSYSIVSATIVNFSNHCGYHVDVVRTDKGRPQVLECALDPSYYCTDFFHGSDNGVTFKSGWGGQNVTMAEFTFNGKNAQDYYDLSVVVGYNVPMQINPNTGSPTVTCTDPSCPDAMHYPTDWSKIHASPTGNIIDVTFCP